MASNRPYINHLAKDLMRLVEANKKDAHILRGLLTEISFRKKSAKKLEPTKLKAEHYIALLPNTKSKKTPQPQVSRPTKTKRPNSLWATRPPAQSNGASTPTNTRPEMAASLPNQVDTPDTHPASLDTLSYKPQLFMKIFGYSEISIDNLIHNHSAIIRSGSSELEITKDVEDWKWTSRLLGNRLEISSGGKRLTFLLPTKLRSQVDRVLAKILFQADIEKAIEDWDHLISVNRYLNHRSILDWHIQHRSAIDASLRFTSTFPEWTKLERIKNALPQSIAAKNSEFVREEIKRWKPFFEKVENSPLSDRQMEAIVTEEDACLVVAGAGTGKTSTVVGKIGYLLNAQHCTKEEVLALAYGREAAEEMRERVKKRLDIDVQIRTFHSLGLEILKNHKGHKLKISEIVTSERPFLALIARLLKGIANEEPGRSLLHEFVSKHRFPVKYLEDFNSQADYFEYLRKVEPYTLRGEKVKSFEELLLADWLCLNGVQYEYEYPYEHQTASSKRNQYRPDFYLKDYGIYLEHFGIDRKGKTAPGIDAKTYNEGIEWKRELHRTHHTTLVETYSWERMEGSILESLEAKLSALNVEIQPYDTDAILDLLETANLNKSIVALLKDFLSVFKENQFSFDEVHDLIKNSNASEAARQACFLKLFEEVYNAYQKYLSDRQEIDFADLINQATLLIEEGAVRLPFTRVIVDEYQDISRGRFKLVNAILEHNCCRLLAVGDDWQSIYGFTGSDIKKTTEFLKVFEGSSSVALDRTFRFTDAIQELSANFVQKNPTQLRKDIKARPPKVPTPIILNIKTGNAQSGDQILKALQIIEQQRPPKQKWSVFLLGRYNFCQPDELDQLRTQFKMLNIDFKTIHSSKGLGADAVVILDVVGGRFGFPSLVENDPIMSLIVPTEHDFENAEERRVMYVAMTRAKEVLVINADTSNPSSFLNELQSQIGTSTEDQAIVEHCPKCRKGILLNKFPKRLKGYAWVCSLAPYCTGEAKYCPECQKAPNLKGQPCGNPDCRIKPKSNNRKLKRRPRTFLFSK